MNVFNCSVHFLTLKQTGYEESNVAVTFYHDRTHFDARQRNLYAQFAEEFNLQQGRQFVLHNRLATTPGKVSHMKDDVKQLDTLLAKTGSRQPSQDEKVQPMSPNIISIVWLAVNRLLLVLNDATLVWMLIDPASGDLIRVLFDDTFTAAKKNPFKLSGKHLCSVSLSKTSNPLLVFLYSDQSRIDFFTFNRAAQASEYLTRGGSVEKLDNFQPTLVRTFDFSCPVGVAIEKRAFFLTPNVLTLWWSNDNQLASSGSMSLLEKNDLRTNIILLSTVDLSTEPNLIEHIFKSDSLLVSLVKLDQGNLLAVEQAETSSHAFQIDVYVYELNSEQTQTPPKKRLNRFTLSSRIAQVKGTNTNTLMLTVDQTIVLYDVHRNLVTKFRLENESEAFTSIEWLLNDLIFCAYNENGRLLLFDVAFNRIDLAYMTRNFIKFNSISQYLTENVFVPNAHGSDATANKFIGLACSRNIHTDSLWSCFHYSKGPLGLFRLALPDKFSCISLMGHYLKASRGELAVKLMNTLDWDRNGYESLTCFYRLMNYLLNEPSESVSERERLVEATLKSFYKPRRELTEQTLLTFRHQVSRLARRFFYALLDNGSLEKAFKLAVDLATKDLFNDLYYCALDKRETQLAEICRKKFHDIENEEMREKMRLDLNKSINSVDDNVSATYREVDRYSVSSSEASSSSLLDDEDDDGEYVRLMGLPSGNDELLKQNLAKKKPASSKLPQPKFYTEVELESYAKEILNENKFIYKLNLDSF